MNSELDKYSLRSQNLGRISGVSLGVHAIPDAFLLMHTGVGCKYKAASQIADHDWHVHPNRREGWTEVGDYALIQGSAQRIGPFARSWAKRRQPALMAMVTSTFLEMTGEDLDGALNETRKDLSCQIVRVPTSGYTGDLYDGYGGLLLKILENVNWDVADSDPDEIGILGYFFDRYEADHQANLQQIKFMLSGIGKKLGPVLLSGRPYADLLNIGRSRHLLGWPHLNAVADEIPKVCPNPVIPVDLPMGLSGTEQWLIRVAKAVGADPKRTALFIKSQLDFARPEINKVAKRMRGMPVSIFSDTPLAAGITNLLVEMGLKPQVIGLRDGSLGGAQAFRDMVKRANTELPDSTEIIENPSIQHTAQLMNRLRTSDRSHLIIGSAVEGGLISHGDDKRGLFIEVGFPSIRYHVTRAEPYLGFGGAVSFAQRVINA